VVFFGLMSLCFVLSFVFQVIDQPTLLQISGLLFGASVVGVLVQTLQSERKRLRDTQRLVDQWRRASALAEKRLREVEVLAAISRRLAASLELRQTLQSVVDQAREVSAADGVSIFVRDPETGELTDYRVTAAVSERYKDLPPPRPKGITYEVARTGESLFIADAQHHPLFADGAYPNLHAIASLPLKLEGEMVGVMNVGYNRPYEFDESTFRLLHAVADNAAVAVHNAELHERLRKQATTDELTGLVNRRRFLELLRTEMQRARRYNHPLSLLMVDLDRLKQINDQHGHAAGDAMLCGVAQCIKVHIRETDVPVRLGGDEFAVLMPETGREAAWSVAERIRTTVEAFRADMGESLISSTVSVGVISRVAGHLQDLPSFLHLADDALYKSKTTGRNRVTVWDETGPGHESRKTIDLSANSG
jgi:diguanylate cyclase (GGDEF)-like protein